MKNHGLWMLIFCALPFLLIFILPKFGISSSAAFLLLMLFGCGLHLLMMRGHQKGHKHDKKND